MQEEAIRLDFFISFSPIKEHELNSLENYYTQSDHLKLYYGESFYVNVVVSKPLHVKFDQAFDKFNIEGNLYSNSSSNRSNSSTNFRKTRAFTSTTKDSTALNWINNEREYKLLSCLIKLDNFSFPDHKLEIYVNNEGSHQNSSQSSLESESDATRDMSSYNGNDDYITDADIDYNILGSLSNDARFQANPPLLPASYISGNIQMDDTKSHPNYISRKRYFNCAIPVLIKLNAYMINEVNQYITCILAPDTSCHSFILKNFTSKSTSSSLSLLGPKYDDGFNATLTGSDLFSIVYQMKLQPSAYRIEIECVCEGTIVRKLNGAYVHGMPFLYKHPTMFVMRKNHLHKHSKQISSNESMTTPTTLLNLLDVSATVPSYVKAGTTFPVSINLYNPSDVPIELVVQVPLYSYDEFFINDNNEANNSKINDGLSSFPPTKPDQIIKLPGLIASTTNFHTGIISPKCEKDFELQFLAYRPGSYDLSSITVKDVHRHHQKPRGLSEALQIIVES
ncbi:TRAPP II complex subunit Trs65 [Schizosaccharomyces osmophilus]|uniref:TRAPP II complex subunit Trs65 n=1 Tax=Schizosaccharomyces osmophilus TaxID=2545709 RepID=A0AAF0AV96_9SCHI|nr:TRAPP II complex subunit Trs65 [Schizosaccharomyces osmophilus]WBW71750.1 TRAPP II complex subunit Trs65 [Schizosaccharomyces osmophilus]